MSTLRLCWGVGRSDRGQGPSAGVQSEGTPRGRQRWGPCGANMGPDGQLLSAKCSLLENTILTNPETQGGSSAMLLVPPCQALWGLVVVSSLSSDP